MNARKRGQQKIYLAVITKTDKYDEYGDKTGDKTTTETKGQDYMASVSTKEQTKIENAGIVIDYDRVITMFKKTPLKEGDRLFIDSDTKADYVIVRNISTEQGLIFRYGIKQIV